MFWIESVVPLLGNPQGVPVPLTAELFIVEYPVLEKVICEGLAVDVTLSNTVEVSVICVALLVKRDEVSARLDL